MEKKLPTFLRKKFLLANTLPHSVIGVYPLSKSALGDEVILRKLNKSHTQRQRMSRGKIE